MISLVIHYSNAGLVSECIEAIRNFATVPYELILLDIVGDGSKYKVDKYVNAQGLDYSEAVNLWKENVSPDNDLLFINSDAIITKGCVEELLRVLSLDATIGIVGTGILAKDIYGKKCDVTINTADYQQVNLLDNECVLVRRKMVDTVGLLNAGQFPHDGADYEWGERVKKAGWKLVVAKKAKITYDHTAFIKRPIDPNKLFIAEEII
jgi:GT2 family glycosyltransferase